MLSSGMRTARLLAVSQHALCRGVWPGGVWPGGVCLGGVCPGGYLPRGVFAQRMSAWGCLPRGVCLPEECVYPSMQWHRHPLWTDRHL